MSKLEVGNNIFHFLQKEKKLRDSIYLTNRLEILKQIKILSV